MSLNVAIETLLASDPDFAMLTDVLYGPGVSAAEIYDDVTGQSSADVAKNLATRSIKAFGVGIKQGITSKAKLVPGPGFAGLDEAGQKKVRRNLSVGRGAGLAISHPITAIKTYPKTAIGTGVAAGAAFEHHRNNKPVEYDPETGVYKLSDTNQRRLGAGLSAVGATAGAGGLAYAAHDVARSRKLKLPVPKKTKFLIPLEAAGLGGEILATKILHGDTRKRSINGLAQVNKSEDFAAQGVFSKFDEDKRLAFGWASIIEKDGLPIVDRQGDYISEGDLEDAAYRYVLESRVGGNMHRRVSKFGDDQAHHVSDLVESFVLTKEKITKMGLPEGTQTGWWVGFKIHDDETWDEVKKGDKVHFSIHGRGKRTDINMDDLVGV